MGPCGWYAVTKQAWLGPVVVCRPDQRLAETVPKDVCGLHKATQYVHLRRSRGAQSCHRMVIMGMQGRLLFPACRAGLSSPSYPVPSHLRLLLCAGIPAVFLVCIYVTMKFQSWKRTLYLWAFLVKCLEPSRWYWEATILFRKFIMVFISVQVSDKYLQVGT